MVRAPTNILGRPLIYSEKVPDLARQRTRSNFIDLANYLVGDRQSMAPTRSEHYKFGDDRTAVRLIERVDGRPWLQSAITPKTASINCMHLSVRRGALP